MRVIDNLLIQNLDALCLKNELSFIRYFEANKRFIELAPKIIIKTSNSESPIAKKLALSMYYNIDTVEIETDLNIKVVDIIGNFACSSMLPVFNKFYIQIPAIGKTVEAKNIMELNFILKYLYTMLFLLEREITDVKTFRSTIASITLSYNVGKEVSAVLSHAANTIIADYRADKKLMNA